MASPNTLKLRGTVPDTSHVYVSGAAMAITMKAENEAYRRWAHQASGHDKRRRTRAAFMLLPDVRERLQSVADEMVKARK
jgi:hypothetical protein